MDQSELPTHVITPTHPETGEPLAPGAYGVRELLRYKVDLTGASSLNSFYCFALNDHDAHKTAAGMVTTLQNEGRGPYANLKISGIRQDPLPHVTMDDAEALS